MQIGMVGPGRRGANMVRRLIQAGHECVVCNRSPGPVHVFSAALYDRFDSRERAGFVNQVLSAMRFQFGGHHEKKGAAK